MVSDNDNKNSAKELKVFITVSMAELILKSLESAHWDNASDKSVASIGRIALKNEIGFTKKKGIIGDK